jgi:hypothetical protein
MNRCWEIGDLATWIMGIATIALFIIGFIQLHNEREIRKREKIEGETKKLRSQAENISCWIVNEDNSEDGYGLGIAILNNSTQPVYQAIIRFVILSQDGGSSYPVETVNPVLISIIPPGLGYTTILASFHGMSRRPGLEMAFSDVYNKYWHRKANGELINLDMEPIRFFDISLPASWENLLPQLPIIE